MKTINPNINYYINKNGVEVLVIKLKDGRIQYHLSYSVDSEVSFEAIVENMTEEEIDGLDGSDVIEIGE